MVEQKQDDHDKSISNLDIECGIEELEVARDKELGFSLENESTRWKKPKEL